MSSDVYRSTALQMVLLAMLLGIVPADSLLAEEVGEALLSYQKPPASSEPTAPMLSTARALESPAQPAVFQAAQADPILETKPQRGADHLRDPRRLAPSRSTRAANPIHSQAQTKRDSLPIGLPQIGSFTTAGAGLAIVVGLFLLCMWLLRRSGPRPSSALPNEAVAVLGRVPLAARNFAHLIQVGRKLVLVSITPDGVVPITEVTDPQEVDRLLGLCMGKSKHSSTAEFQQVLQQLAQEPAQGFLGAEGKRSFAPTRNA